MSNTRINSDREQQILHKQFYSQRLVATVCVIALLLSATACAYSDSSVTSADNPTMSSSSSAIALPPPTTLNQETLSTESQGVVGTVQVLSGNHMPGPDAMQSDQATELISTKVWIFAGSVQSNLSPRWALSDAEQHPSLVGWTMSDDEGKFAVGLPIGEYTLLAQYGDDLYLNSFQGDGSYSLVEVVKNEVTELELINSENAVF